MFQMTTLKDGKMQPNPHKHLLSKKLLRLRKEMGTKCMHASIVAFILKNKKGDYERIEDIRHKKSQFKMMTKHFDLHTDLSKSINCSFFI